MHETLVGIQGMLTKLAAQVQAAIPNDEPFAVAHGNWSFPGLSRVELVEEAQSLIDLIEDRGGDDVTAGEARLKDYGRRLEFLRANTVGQLWGNSAQAVPVYMFTLAGLRKALEPALSVDKHTDAATRLRKLSTQLRGMEARIRGLEPRTTTVASMVEMIEQAYNAADQLPADLESLEEARQKITEIAQHATEDQVRVLDIRQGAEAIEEKLKSSAAEAKAVLARCETAYSAATSVGLAAAFTERSEALSKSMWFWIVGLVLALCAGSYFSAGRLQALSELFNLPNASPAVVVLNLLLSVLSVAAPVWFAWLATKQIGQRFRLSEDYAFKASISRAYEGFRKEAARFDKDMEARLLSSALTRLDELPLRLVETDTHGSPWHELASSNTVKRAMSAVPGFAEQVNALAASGLRGLTPKAKAKDPAPVPAGDDS